MNFPCVVYLDFPPDKVPKPCKMLELRKESQFLANNTEFGAASGLVKLEIDDANENTSLVNCLFPFGFMYGESTAEAPLSEFPNPESNIKLQPMQIQTSSNEFQHPISPPNSYSSTISPPISIVEESDQPKISYSVQRLLSKLEKEDFESCTSNEWKEDLMLPQEDRCYQLQGDSFRKIEVEQENDIGSSEKNPKKSTKSKKSNNKGGNSKDTNQIQLMMMMMSDDGCSSSENDNVVTIKKGKKRGHKQVNFFMSSFSSIMMFFCTTFHYLDDLFGYHKAPWSLHSVHCFTT